MADPEIHSVAESTGVCLLRARRCGAAYVHDLHPIRPKERALLGIGEWGPCPDTVAGGDPCLTVSRHTFQETENGQ